MPRDGSGKSDNNPIETGDNLVHGAGSDAPTEIQHTKKVADPPEYEKGAALEGLPASGGGASGEHNTQGSGPGIEKDVKEGLSK